MIKYPLWVQKLLYYTIYNMRAVGRHIDFRQMSIHVYLRRKLRLTTARWLSAYMSSRALTTTTTSSYYYYYYYIPWRHSVGPALRSR